MCFWETCEAGTGMTGNLDKIKKLALVVISITRKITKGYKINNE